MTTYAELVVDLIEKLFKEFDAHDVGSAYSNSYSTALPVEW